MSRPTFSLLLTTALALAVLSAALAPSPEEVSLYGIDKVKHAGAFAVLTLPTALLAPRLLRWSLPGLLLLGGLIEILQPWFGRDRSVYDVCADGAGIILGLLLARALRKGLSRSA
ncbi:VanZ family protein [Pseudooceanicola sp. CBS1P-1]|uniref:VanZ family protein n=1 Tax=Pseudooceanicola albus TaxID=2692189 RepID=A0A6L7GB60_9RHOB|nr:MULTISPECIES: VanZ family protein [Pseudooceanicola]MBT9386749.1 VanZ family protein [Pseudooceanicola endophyticus]MXN20768.1 VanZ family protein [Pseudooceanicola albus]